VGGAHTLLCCAHRRTLLCGLARLTTTHQRVALITGATHGIGYQLPRRLTAAGTTVVVLVIAAALIAAMIPGADQQVGLGLVAVAVGLCAAITVHHRALAAAVALGWLVANGFLEDRLGELFWHGSADLYLIMLLMMAGALGLTVGEAHHQVQRLRTRWHADEEFRLIAAQFEEEKHNA
jgi:NAD(P)-dependent dehydrogenase (short-subunit alcohol dehydrogenase family)